MVYNKSNKNIRRRQDRRNYTDNTTYGYQGKPEESEAVDDRISFKALKDLPHSSYALKADPYQAALPTSEPYPLLNKYNRIIGGNYKGEDNLDGGNVQQYANSSTSNFLQTYDVARLKINVNYRYLPIVPTSGTRTGKQLVDEMRKSIAESYSVLRATTFTNMAINNFAVETDLPMGSATTTTVGAHKLYTNTVDVLYAMSIYYQLVLQNGLSVMNWHNSFRLKQGVAIRNAFNREVPVLNSFFGLMNKKAFLSMLESINLSFEGEYVDKDFMEQMNTLCLTPSRRSNSMDDPILELQCGFNHPTQFKVYYLSDNGELVSETPLYDDAELTYNGTSYWTACDNLRNMLSLEDTTLWARSNYVAGQVPDTDTARYNTIKGYFDVIVNSFTVFKPRWSDFREAFDVMTRTQTISWTKGFRPAIVQSTDMALFHNILVDHIYQLIMSGNNKLLYNNNTKRWTSYSLWNKYTGTPAYDAKSGGAFLAFSFKDMSEIETNEQIEYLPLLFDVYTSASGATCEFVNRSGNAVPVTITVENIQLNSVLCRLAPLASQANLEIRVPTVQYDAVRTRGQISNLYKVLTQTFGLCRIDTSTTESDYSVDPDILAVYQFEINDITNMAITYARASAPFKGTTSEAGLLGFSSFGVSKS